MIWAELFTALYLITLHGPTGVEIDVNINEISTIRRPEAFEDKQHLTKGVNCVLVMNNARILSTRETCAEIVEKIAAANKEMR